ncbi:MULTISPECIES: inositol monophosphatase family protein [Azospira]|jgi:myo-inositol-1(or 4)-monophosphatase|uniref:Inositol monophosphatase/fructose-1,6-bisphosphatase family protein n=2 Tax=Azospira oryzae TaxID=146939 RepID=G8QPP6_AZOOP|nr:MULTISPECIES: inositol monophosphatase [Azospira]AEV25955.1 inositol monophosphatase/fructose-1,6-bisphosphatase family protein [Azospira oryzae PS]MBP7489274.1 inositol monophosphatase [Azospira sp.]MDK9690625.1 inositol monophosphatase [Azospira sp.]RZT75781.1 myo-inositol-1(or 4)-monophosphatase [Azospira oryzae]
MRYADNANRHTVETVIAAVHQVAREAIVPRFMKAIHHRKDDGTLLSEADLACQSFLLQRLPEIVPCPVIGEEMSRAEQEAALEAGNGDVWCIDPIDGTTNFVNGLPVFAVSIALLRERKPRLGITYNPITNELFYAWEGGGAYVNGKRLPLRRVAGSLDQAVANVDLKRLPRELAVRIATAPPFFSQRNFGSSALEWCQVAAGRIDVAVHGGQMLWDYAAGCLILKEAGGHMCTLEQDDFHADDLWRRRIVAALDPGVFAAWRDWLRAGL